MKPTFALSVLALLLTAAPPLAAQEPPVPGAVRNPPPLVNLGQFKDQYIAYVESGVYMTQIAEVAAKAREDLLARVKAKKADEKLAVVLDIDETCLSNWAFLYKYNFGYEPALFLAWVNEEAATAIAPTLAFFQEAVRQGVPVFLVTGRHESWRAATEANLKKAGYTGYATLVMKPDDYHQPSVIPYKSAARAAIEAEGYTIVVNMGDQWSDLQGGHAEQSYKLPDPFYFLK